ncbi:glycosyltransferase [Dactylosporangium sp. NPDC051541]|uniref:glycosyltransferase n=1 Tax=Dactylosporangium sp. NPDC051541 TaxID=3363977 RepID=UPI0037ADD55D
MRRLRILRVLTRMNVGGPSMQVTTLHRHLDPDRYEQRLCTGHVGEDEADYQALFAPELPVHRIPTLGRRIGPGGDAYAFAKLFAHMREFRPHIVHTHTAKAGVLGRLAAVAAGVPVRVHTFHGHLLHGYFSARATRVMTAVESALARRTQRLVSVGAQVRDDLLAAGVGVTRQYRVIAPGTVLPTLPDRAAARRELGLPDDGPVVAYVGRVTGIKRPDRFLAAARIVRAAVPETTFVVCGAGDRLAETRAAATDLGDAVRFTGWRADVHTVYAAADVVLLTSDNEGTPVSLIEAALAGRPAVATRVGSVDEVVCDNRTGLLTPPDAEPLAAATIRLLRDGSLRERLGRQAAEHAANAFGPGRLVSGIDRLYSELAVERGWWPEHRAVSAAP